MSKYQVVSQTGNVYTMRDTIDDALRVNLRKGSGTIRDIETGNIIYVRGSSYSTMQLFYGWRKPEDDFVSYRDYRKDSDGAWWVRVGESWYPDTSDPQTLILLESRGE